MKNSLVKSTALRRDLRYVHENFGMFHLLLDFAYKKRVKKQSELFGAIMIAIKALQSDSARLLRKYQTTNCSGAS